MASPTQWTWVWASFGSWWWARRPGIVRFIGHNWASQTWLSDWTELNQVSWCGSCYLSKLWPATLLFLCPNHTGLFSDLRHRVFSTAHSLCLVVPSTWKNSPDKSSYFWLLFFHRSQLKCLHLDKSLPIVQSKVVIQLPSYDLVSFSLLFLWIANIFFILICPFYCSLPFFR